MTFVFIFLSFHAFGDEEAVSSTGKRVILKDNGTWILAPVKAVSGKDFRNTNWGMTIDQVQAAEGIAKKDIIFSNELGFAVKLNVATMDCATYYIFAFDKLVRTKYAFLVEHSNETDYINVDFPKIKKLLTEKYGKPIDDSVVWKNSLYKDDPDEWGMALQVGHLVYFARWQTETTNVFLYLSGENYDISFGVEYTSVALGDLEESAATQKAKDEF